MLIDELLAAIYVFFHNLNLILNIFNLKIILRIRRVRIIAKYLDIHVKELKDQPQFVELDPLQNMS